MAGQLPSQVKPSWAGKIPKCAAILATSIGTKILNPALAANPIPKVIAVIISVSIEFYFILFILLWKIAFFAVPVS
jgi:hypothetical protein